MMREEGSLLGRLIMSCGMSEICEIGCVLVSDFIAVSVPFSVQLWREPLLRRRRGKGFG